MQKFIAYFDILGFAKFLEHNGKEYVDRMMDHLFRDSQMALTEGLLRDGGPGVVVPDLSQSKVNCLHISDSIIFWSVDDSEESFRNIVKVCEKFINQTLQTSFPMRGCLSLGDIEFKPFTINTAQGTTFINSSLYGTGLLNAYNQAEAQQWVGCYVDNIASAQFPAVINELTADGTLVAHQIPVKNNQFINGNVFALAPAGINETLYGNLVTRVQHAFIKHLNGNELDPVVQPKIDNTIDFVGYFRE